MHLRFLDHYGRQKCCKLILGYSSQCSKTAQRGRIVLALLRLQFFLKGSPKNIRKQRRQIVTPVVTVCIILYFQDNDVQHNKKSPRKVTKQFFNLLSQQLFPSRYALTHIAGEGIPYTLQRDKLPCLPRPINPMGSEEVRTITLLIRLLVFFA